jgi:hypothetical protein
VCEACGEHYLLDQPALMVGDTEFSRLTYEIRYCRSCVTIAAAAFGSD